MSLSKIVNAQSYADYLMATGSEDSLEAMSAYWKSQDDVVSVVRDEVDACVHEETEQAYDNGVEHGRSQVKDKLQLFLDSGELSASSLQEFIDEL